MDNIAVLDFGGQYTHLISRRIRDMNVFSQVLPAETDAKKIKDIHGLRGMILSGGAASVYDEGSPKCDPNLLGLGIPILGICYGHQLIAFLEQGKVASEKKGEYGLTEMEVIGSVKSKLMDGAGRKLKVWMNHGDAVQKLPEGYEVIASTRNSPVAVFENNQKNIFCVQFHPEVTHTEKGDMILRNFVLGVCNAKKEWTANRFVDDSIREAKEKIGERRAVIGLSGGVDSSTAAIMVSRAIGDRLTAVYVDTGLMRQGETEFIEKAFSGYDLNLKIIRAKERFFNELKRVDEPERKRKIIGKTFIDIFEEVAQKEGADLLIQGTIYSDRIESGSSKHSSKIKSHHNVGGLPERMRMEVYEPLRELYKDEVRKIAAQVGLPDKISKRHVFPGPGLGVRIVGEVTAEKADIVRRASFIVEEELEKAGLYQKAWMAFAVLLPIKSVGIQGDARSYKYPVAIRVIESKDAMTANFSKIPHDVLEKISTRITNEINEVNRVVYDITNKPPATMEWE